MCKRRYNDIIRLSHHQSELRPHMTLHDRAAQFAPFAALVGYDNMVRDVAGYRLLEQCVILSEDEKNILDNNLHLVIERIKQSPKIKVVYFDEMVDGQKGRYVSHVGEVKKVEGNPVRITFLDGCNIQVEDIIQIDFEK